MVEVKVDELPDTVVVVEAVQNGILKVMMVTKNQTLFIPIINNAKARLTLHPGTLLVTYLQVKDEQLEVEDVPATVAHISEAIGPDNDCVMRRPQEVPKTQDLGNKMTVLAVSWEHNQRLQKVAPQQYSSIQLVPGHRETLLV
ncbi:hypothetical protein E2C01_038960 [Portunus trituberculatus]|uniref:Uncharacterized protein n=1 Tax=Portunus trituberculatus TaxID=210409 RepID=A0A5B7FIC3_PORTR|nr:hypothetical protein [Portunus trituberculatus]